MDMDDIVGWHYDTKGRFSVKSAYKVQRAAEIRSQTRAILSGVGSSSSDSKFWKRLWNVDCPTKGETFSLETQSQHTCSLQSSAAPGFAARPYLLYMW